MLKYFFLLVFLFGCSLVRVIECDEFDKKGDEICQQKCEGCNVQCFKVVKKFTVVDEQTGKVRYRCECEPFQEKFFLRFL